MEEIQNQIKKLQEQLKEYIQPKKTIKYLVFSGGSSKGFSYIGCIKALEEYGLINDLEEIAGTSIGGFFGLMILLKLRANDLISIFNYLDLNLLHNINSDSILNFINKYGLDTGLNLEKFIGLFLELRFPNKNPLDITFKDLWDFNPIKLSVFGTKIYKGLIEPEIYNHIISPKMSVIKAIQITMCLPPLFTPIERDDYHLLDGGLVNNYPIDLFDSDDKLEYTLGILCLEKLNKEKCSSLVDIYKSIITNLCVKETQNKIEKYKNNSIVIELELPIYQIFNLTIEDKNNIIMVGYQLTKQYLTLKKFEIKETFINDQNQNQTKTKNNEIDSNELKIFLAKLEYVLTNLKKKDKK